jgi:lipoyl(octanoyl) transferase
MSTLSGKTLRSAENVWRLLPFQLFDAFDNMARDEAVFRVHGESEKSPTLRFYGWLKPTVSLGYFQNVSEEINVAYCARQGIDIVRRPTGGRAVLHEVELTYSVVAREDHAFFSRDLLETYKVINACFMRGLSRLGIEAVMASEGRSPGHKGPEAFCFSVPSQYELLVKGKKICGSAQLRSRGVFLQHGSLLIDFDPVKTWRVMSPRGEGSQKEMDAIRNSATSLVELLGRRIQPVEISRIMIMSFEEVFNISLVPGELTPEEEEKRKQLLREKYRSNLWNMEGKTGLQKN